MIRTEKAHLLVSALSHPGMSGKNNEDAYAVSAYQVSAENPLPSVLAIVSDGIGGHRGGEVAAEIAVDFISQIVAQSNAEEPIQTLQEAVHTASQAIAQRSNDDPALKGMGATCACTWVIGSRLYTASIGDSRIYLLRRGEIWRLTTDHTWIQEALDKGILTPDQAKGHPNAHVIRRYLGSPEPPDVDTRMKVQEDESDTQARANQGMRLIPGDTLMLCTDGLTDLVSDEEIRTTVRGRSLETEAKSLIDTANNRGGHDNLSVILLNMPAQGEEYRKLKITRWLIGSLVGIFILAAISVSLWALFQPERQTDLLAQATPTNELQLVSTQSLPSIDPTEQANTPSPQNTSAAPPGALFAPTYTPWPTNTP
jgi:protein phosphatase